MSLRVSNGERPTFSIFLFLFAAFFPININAYGQSPSDAKPSQKILIGVDGFSREAFEAARKLGLFKIFKNASTHVAPFPSMSDYSWNAIVQSRVVHQARGRIGSVEAVFFDESTQTIKDDWREYFLRLGSPYFYFGAFRSFLNPYVEIMMYFPNQEVFALELKELKQDLFDHSDIPLMTAFVSSVDSLAHTQKGKLYPFLKEFNDVLEEFQAQQRKQGRDPEIILVSDHGNVGRFQELEEETELLGVSLEERFTEAGFRFTKKLENPRDVAIPSLAPANYAAVYFKNKINVPIALVQLVREPWFDLGILVKLSNQDVMILEVWSPDGIGHIVYHRDKRTYTYYFEGKSNPLKLPVDNAFGGHVFQLNETNAMDPTLRTPYPDSIHRIVQAALSEDFDFPHLMVTAKDGYFFRSSADTYVSMIRTHGGLSARSTNGILVSTHRTFPEHIRTEDVLGKVDIPPGDLFEPRFEGKKGFLSDVKANLDQAEKDALKGFKVSRPQFDMKNSYHFFNRAVELSKFYFDAPSLRSIYGLVHEVIESQASSVTSSAPVFDLVSLKDAPGLSSEEIGLLADLVLRHRTLEKIKADPQFQKLKENIFQRYHINENRIGEKTEDWSRSTVPIKHLVVKSYGVSLFLEKLLEIPEFGLLPDDRDRAWVQQWYGRAQYEAREPTRWKLETEKGTYQKLFSEVFKERKLSSQMEPRPIPLYFVDNPPEDVTVVYVGGTYNSIFDNEIFQVGLEGLHRRTGVRVVNPPANSRCSSEYNAKVIADFLKKDIEQRKELGFYYPKYFFVTYSKGAIDSLYAFAANRALVESNVLGLVAIGAPLQGTKLLERADIPFEVQDLLSSEAIPLECQGTGRASVNLTPNAMRSFWKNNIDKLIGLTRYYSISFQSTLEDAHLWMKLMKWLAEFDEVNDGVVTLSSSRFPQELQSIDFGIVPADHLAGITASKFPQTPFLEAVILSLGQLKAFGVSENRQWKEESYQVLASKPEKKAELKISEFLLSGILPRYLRASHGSSWKPKGVYYDVYLDSAFSVIDPEQLPELGQEIYTSLKGTSLEVPRFLLFAQAGKSFIMLETETKDSPEDFVEVRTLGDLFMSLRDFSQIHKNSKSLKANFSKETPLVFPSSPVPLEFSLSDRIHLRTYGGTVETKKVNPFLPAQYPGGISIVYNHTRVEDFRTDYRFSFETSAPEDCDENATSGYLSVEGLSEDGTEKTQYVQLSSKNTSIRLSSFHYRFKPADFSKFKIKIAIQDDVVGADPVAGGSGKDDAAFQIWFTIRVLKPGQNRSIWVSDEPLVLFGYYFGAQDEKDKLGHQVGVPYENWYSNYSMVITSLPEAWEIPLEFGVHPQMGTYTRDLKEDLKKAFPKLNVDHMEIGAITLQHDSNDTKGDSKVLLKEVSFEPTETGAVR